MTKVVVACGALALHIDQIAKRRGWEIEVRPLPPELHNRPERIRAAVDAARRRRRRLRGLRHARRARRPAAPARRRLLPALRRDGARDRDVLPDRLPRALVRPRRLARARARPPSRSCATTTSATTSASSGSPSRRRPSCTRRRRSPPQRSACRSTVRDTGDTGLERCPRTSTPGGS